MKQVYRTQMGQPEKFTLPKICVCIFFGCFFFGVLSANLGLSDEALWVGFVNENNIRQFTAQGRDVYGFLGFALQNRLLPWVIILICGTFFWGIALCGVWFGWMGFTGGFLMTALIQRHGLRGILIMAGMGFPHILIYAAAYLILLKWVWIIRKERKNFNADTLNRRSGKKYAGIYFLSAILISCIFSLGILAEYYISPLILSNMI